MSSIILVFLFDLLWCLNKYLKCISLQCDSNAIHFESTEVGEIMIWRVEMGVGDREVDRGGEITELPAARKD